MIRHLLIFVLLLSSSWVFSQNLKVRLYARYSVKEFDLSYYHGTYEIYGDTILLGTINTDELAKVKSSGDDKVKVLINGETIGSYNEVRLSQDSLGSTMRVKSISPSIKTHTFDDNFTITGEDGSLKIINEVEIANYLAGVIESEGGGGRHLEYYKVQALISRTYVLKHIERHSSEGYNVCDAVHCQAYHNKLKHTPTIMDAVLQTKGEIIVDSEDQMLSSYFHANCGGQTSDGSFVWKNSISYCQPFIDTFCTKSKQATWTKTVSRRSWENFLKSQYDFPINNKLVKESMYAFAQPYRKAFYIHPSLGVPLRDLRSEFKLKSTFFSVSKSGSDVILKGRGFGHGIGLCQEGAMEMAKRGYSYKQIATYYFDDVRIMGHQDFLYYQGTNGE